MLKLVCSAREERMWQFVHFSASWLRAAYITDVNVEPRTHRWVSALGEMYCLVATHKAPSMNAMKAYRGLEV